MKFLTILVLLVLVINLFTVDALERKRRRNKRKEEKEEENEDNEGHKSGGVAREHHLKEYEPSKAKPANEYEKKVIDYNLIKKKHRRNRK